MPPMQQTRSNRAWAVFIFAIMVLQVTAISAMAHKQVSQSASTHEDTEIAGFPEGWSYDIRLTYAQDYSRSPDMAVEGDHVYIIWKDKRSGSYEVYFKKSGDSGRTWSEDMKISEFTPSPFCEPKIAVNGSQLHVVWEGLDITREVHYRNSWDGGETWNPEIVLSENDGFHSYIPRICVVDNYIHVVWDDKKDYPPAPGGEPEIYYRNSTNGGISWNSIQRLTYYADADGSAKIQANGTKIHITWARWLTKNEVFYMNSPDGGITWNPEQQLTPNDGIESGPWDLAVWYDNVHIVFRDAIDGSEEVYYINSTNGGSTWNAIRRISDLPDASRNTRICGNGTNIYIAWQDQRDNYPYIGASNIYYTISNDNGNYWSENIRLTHQTVGACGEPTIATDNSIVHVVWQDNRSSDTIIDREIYYKRYPDFPADTTPPVINHTPVTNIHYSQPINITAEISDNVAISSVRLNYTDVNGTNYNVSMNGWNRKMVMVSGSGSTLYAQKGNYLYEIPAQGLPGTLSYFIWANDTSGNANMTGVYQVQILALAEIALRPGWNLISMPLILADTSVENVLSSISGKWEVVKWYDGLTKTWKTYRVGSSMNTFFHIDRTMGFWLHALEFCNLTVSGEIPASTSITLYAGWNLVGYSSMTEETVSNALWGTGADRVEVYQSESPYIREAESTYVMKPGEGFWVRVSVDSVWVVDW